MPRTYATVPLFVSVLIFKLRDKPLKLRREACHALLADVLRDAKVGFGNGAGDAANGVAVTAKADGVADAVLKVIAVEEGANGLWYAALAGGTIAFVVQPFPRVSGTQLIDGER